MESFSNQTSKNLKSKRKKFDRQVFACKTLSLADSSSVANDVQRRIKKVTPLLLLDVTEAWRPFWIRESELDKKLKFDDESKINHKRKKTSYDQSYSDHQCHLFRGKFA
jgi:hypothetical protein